MSRKAHCLGCGNTFPKMHLMINHRRTQRCGGRFLPHSEWYNYAMYSFFKKEAERIRYYDLDGYNICLAKANDYYESFLHERSIRHKFAGVPDVSSVMMTGLPRKRKHKARVPGTTRDSRMPFGSGFRGWKTWQQEGVK